MSVHGLEQEMDFFIPLRKGQSESADNRDRILSIDV